MMDYEAFRFWFDLAQFAATCLIGLYVWIGNRHTVTIKRITQMEDDIDGRLDDHGNRISRVEERIQHLPSQAQLAHLHESQSLVAEKLNLLIGRVDGINRAVDLMNQHLLSKSPGGGT